MKQRVPSQTEVDALRITLRRAVFAAVVGLAAALAAMALSTEFLLMHMVLLAAVSLSGGLSCARVALPVDPPSYRRSGNIGGMAAALAFVAPFIILFTYWAAVVDQTMAAELAGRMSAVETTRLIEQNIQVGVDYYRGQYISFASGYLLFGLLSGFAFGTLGAAIAKRSWTARAARA